MSQHKCVGFTLFGRGVHFCDATNCGAEMLEQRRAFIPTERAIQTQSIALASENAPWMNR
jgi:hypothetical protein